MALAPEILAALKRRAADQGRSVQDLVNEFLRQGLRSRGTHPAYRLRLGGWKAKLQPGVDLEDREKLFDLLGGR